MSRENSPYIVGDYWLDKRRDGLSPDIWQIAGYAPKSRSVVYRSTRARTLDDAKPVIHAFVEAELAKQPQRAEDAAVIPLLLLSYKEHGRHVRAPAQVASSLRAWIGFFLQDELGASVTVAQINPAVVDRFRMWRMGPHVYSVPWGDRDFAHASEGVTGETVKRNLDDFRAALNHAADRGRIPFVPRIPNLPREYRSPPRDVRLTLAQLGAIVAFTRPDKTIHRWVLLMIATACRPDAALAFDPALQDHDTLLDMHPPAWPRTKKVNPWVPCIKPLRAEIDRWKKDPAPNAKSRKTAWRTMRAALGLPSNVVPKTIRHTIATELRRRGVPGGEVSGLLGHADPSMHRTSGVYAKYDPAHLAKASRALTRIWAEVMAESQRWSADHLRTKLGNGKIEVIDKSG